MTAELYISTNESIQSVVSQVLPEGFKLDEKIEPDLDNYFLLASKTNHYPNHRGANIEYIILEIIKTRRGWKVNLI